MKTEKLFDKLFHPKADGHISKPETIAFAESYHKQKVESINNRTMKLIKMSDYVLWIRGMTTTEFCKAFPNDTKLPTWKGDVKTAANEFIVLDAIKYRLIGDMAKFLKQPLKLGMFIPCDEDGDILTEPESLKGYYETDKDGMDQEKLMRKQYQQALSNVIFKGFEVKRENPFYCIIDNNDVWLEFDKEDNNQCSNPNGWIETIEDLTDLGIELIKDNYDKNGNYDKRN